MTEIKEVNKLNLPPALADYPYHLPDKPFPVGKISYEEFLDWADEDTLAEWVDGEIEMASPASSRHQRIASFLDRLLGLFAQNYDLGQVFPPPFQMKLPYSGREPDLVFVTKDHLERVKEVYLDGPADMVIEVVSKESRLRDRVTKFNEYRLGGVPEYWLIYPTRKQKQAIFYQLDERGQYQAAALDSAGKYHSRALPGFWLKEAWLWQEPLPDLEQVLKEIEGVNYFRRQLKTGGANYVQQLIEELREQGFLPPNS